MSTRRPYLKAYARDWLTGTRVLSPEARGIYWDIIMLMQDRDARLKMDEQNLCRDLALANPRTLRRILGELFTKGKLAVTTDGWITQKRMEIEMAKAAQEEPMPGKIGQSSADDCPIIDQSSGDDRAMIGQSSGNVGKIAEQIQTHQSPDGGPRARERAGVISHSHIDNTSSSSIPSSARDDDDEKIPIWLLRDAGEQRQRLIRLAKSFKLGDDTAGALIDGALKSLTAEEIRTILADGTARAWDRNALRAAIGGAIDAKNPRHKKPEPTPQYLAILRRDLERFKTDPATWPNFRGAPPGSPDCRIDAALLAEFGLDDGSPPRGKEAA